ncbi:MAG TPA: hypothetical protein DD400_04360 [Rhodospirillaceae bacterium]|nr:hypothetical protein [Rhodospirillaceae bacterium]
MKKLLSFLAVFVSLSCFALPAKADTNVSFSFNANPFHVAHGQRFISHHGKKVRHRVHRRSRRPNFSWAFYRPRHRTVIVERTVIQPVYHTRSYAQSLKAVPVSADYTGNSGQYCREYQSVGSVSGLGAPLYGTACLQPDGSWRVVN